ncbi:A24 family peptidase [Nocardioides sp. SYSU D00038]|uniref:prepilin peptidase n=1 Tax=Nocardioides sp. SYSU D00038 TaxID=2812554 RepID=UPI001968643D|nr:A24 family peptidase [Nocardioides sp. SYSU D00038]
MSTLVAVLIGAAAGAAGGVLVPPVVRAVPELPPEPPPDPQPELQQPQAEPPARRRPRRPAPVVRLWGLRADDGTRETFAEMSRLRGLAVGSAVAGTAVGAVLGLALGLGPELAVLLVLLPVLLALAVVDWRSRLLPKRLVLPATGLVVLAGAAGALVTGERGDLVRALVGLLVVRSFFWLLWWVRSAGMGFGDVRLAALVGFVLGWAGWPELLVGVYLGFIVFVVPGLLLAAAHRSWSLMKVAFPFGPFMLLGALLGLLLGDPLAGGLGP